MRSHLRPDRHATAAAAAFVVISLAVVLGTTAERSGWIMMTNALTPRHYSMVGYVVVAADSVLHIENLPFINQAAVWNGVASGLDLYAVRAFYSWGASLLVPAFGYRGALLAANWAGWAVAAWLSWRLTRRLTGSRGAALLAVLLVAVGIGMVAHVRDLSAHLWSYVFYFGGVTLIYESGVWREPRGWRTHLTLAAYLALATLQYNSGLVLFLVYVLASAKHNRWSMLLASAALVLPAQTAWHGYLNLLNRVVNHAPEWVDFYRVEREYLGTSLHGWLEVLAHDGVVVVTGEVLRVFVDFALFTSPLTLAAAVAALVVTRVPARWLWVAFWLAPIGAGMVYARTAAARGYLVYGTAIVVYALAAAFVLEVHRRRRAAGLALAALLVALEATWGTAHLWGNVAPLKTYYAGIGTSAPLFLGAPAVQSLTGHEATPALFGGGATLLDAGLLPCTRSELVRGDTRLALLAHAFHAGWLLLFLVLALRGRARLLAAGVVVGTVLASSVATGVIAQPMWGVCDTKLDAFRGTYCVRVADEFRTALAAQGRPGDLVTVRMGGPGMPPIRVRVGERPVALAESPAWKLWAADAVELMTALDGSRDVCVELDGPVALTGWQRPDLPDRWSTDRRSVVPIFELMLVRGRRPLLVGF